MLNGLTPRNNFTVNYISFDGLTTSVVVSGNGLIVSNTGTTSTNQGANALASHGRASGKFYFEITLTTLAGGTDYGLGIGPATTIFTNFTSDPSVGMFVSGNIRGTGGALEGAIGARSAGDILGFAADLNGHNIWIKKLNGTPTGWNEVTPTTFDPATNVGGAACPSGVMVPFAVFGGTGGLAIGVQTWNFGTSPFFGPVPSGFTAGWRI